MSRVLAVDPGNEDGAAVLLAEDGITALQAWSWHRRNNKARTLYLRHVLDGAEKARREVASMHAVGRVIDLDARYYGGAPPRPTLAVEGLFVKPGAKYGPSVLVLAEATGEVMGPLREASAGEPQRPMYATWTAKVLHLGQYTRTATAEKRCLATVAANAKGLVPLLGIVHVCDAWCIGRYTWGVAQARAKKGTR